jgi:hypothetical protein
MRMPILPSLAALLLGVATALLVACGGDGRIPASDASRVDNALDEVAADFRAGNCPGAEQAVARARGALLNLPDSVDPALRDRLSSGLTKLRAQVPATCGQAQTQTQETQPTDTNQTQSTQTNTTSTDTTGTGTDTTGTGTDTQPTDSTGTSTTGTTTGGTSTGPVPPTTGATGNGGTPPGGNGR